MGEGEGIHTHKKGRGSRVRAVIDLCTKQTHTHTDRRMLHNWQLNCLPPFLFFSNFPPYPSMLQNVL
jgi:hypothetical protein